MTEDSDSDVFLNDEDAPDGSWRKALGRLSGYWENPCWYDLHLERKLPLVKPMLEELVFAMPPLRIGAKVADILAGSGRASHALAKAYPNAEYWLFDQDQERLSMASLRLEKILHCCKRVNFYFSDDGHLQVGKLTDDEAKPEALPLPNFDVVIISLGIRHIVQPKPHYARSKVVDLSQREIKDRFKKAFEFFYSNLINGGHLIICDHTGVMGVFQQMQIMSEVGFKEVDVSWRKQDFYIIGGRK
eukprot:g4449.t1